MPHFPHLRGNGSVSSSWLLPRTAPEAAAAQKSCLRSDEEGQSHGRAVGQRTLCGAEDLDSPLLSPITLSIAATLSTVIPIQFFEIYPGLHYFFLLTLPQRNRSYPTSTRAGLGEDHRSPQTVIELAAGEASPLWQLLVNPTCPSWQLSGAQHQNPLQRLPSAQPAEGPGCQPACRTGQDQDHGRASPGRHLGPGLAPPHCSLILRHVRLMVCLTAKAAAGRNRCCGPHTFRASQQSSEAGERGSQTLPWPMAGQTQLHIVPSTGETFSCSFFFCTGITWIWQRASFAP